MSVDEIKNYLSYDPIEGSLTWIRDSAYNVKAGKKINLKTKKRPKLGFKRKTYSVHRVVWFLYYGEWPKNQIDHIDHDWSNIKIENLREATQSQNNMNRRKLKNKSSIYKGVTKIKENIWRAQIRRDNNLYHLGMFKTEQEAASVYDEVAQKLFGKFCKINEAIS